MGRSLVFCAVVVLVGSGCFLPLSASAPQSATTVGARQAGVTAYVEFPSPDLGGTISDREMKISPSLSGVAQVAYGLTDTLDLELGAEGMLYLFIVPVPTGLSAGGRYQFLEGGEVDAAFAGRLGWTGFSATVNGEEHWIRSRYAMLSISGQRAAGTFRPGAALSLVPAAVEFNVDGASGDRWALTASATVNLAFDFGAFELTPYIGGVFFTGDAVSRPTLFPQGGLALALRGQKTRPEPEALVKETPAPAPPPSL